MSSILPLPLEPQSLTPFSQHALYPSSSVNEQVAILEACLAGGHIGRAKNVWAKLRQSHSLDPLKTQIPRGELDVLPKLYQVVSPAIHAAFLRAFYRDALSSAKSKHAVVREAWNWFRMLVKEGHEVGHPRLQAFAVMLKGAISTIKEESTVVNQTDDIANLIALLPKYDLTLSLVLSDPIFSSSAPAALGPLTVDEALEYLDGIIFTTGLPSDLTATARAELKTLDADVSASQPADQESQPDPLENVPSLDPTMKPGISSDGKVGPVPADLDASVPGRLDSLRSHLLSITGQRSSLTDPQLRQRFLEESAYDAARLQAETELENLKAKHLDANVAMGGDDMKSLMYQWTNKLKEHLDAAQNDPAGSAKRNFGKSSVYADEHNFIYLIPTEKTAYLTVSEILRIQDSGPVHEGLTIASACVIVGRAMEREYQAVEIQTRDAEKYKRQMELARLGMLGVGGKAAELRRMWKRELETKELESKTDAALESWTQVIRVRVGASLISSLIEVATIKRKVEVVETDSLGEEYTKVYSEEQPAFFHSYQYVKGSKLGVIKLNPALSERLDRDPLMATVHPRQLPMIIPPRIWTDWNIGCYMVHRTEMMRFRDSPEQLQHIKKAAENRELDTVFAALDVLGSTAWSINRQVYDVISQVWNSGESLAGLPVKDPLLNIRDPPRPKDVDTDLAARTMYRRELKEAELFRRNQHSERCTINYKLEIARAYIGETFYFPHNVDFRGRTYPIPPHFSHIGDDVSRGLLQFAQAKTVGVSGLRWMKIHLANCYGFDKQSLDARETFATDHMENIADSASDPLGGNRWWLGAEDPWQCLATCIELHQAYKLDEPTTYKSCLPVHQDGTCNGLQHYAALGGDTLGAQAVNLVAGEKPSDVYGNVAQLVSLAVAADAEAGDRLANLLTGKITRKVVKQTVMTTVYGVTFVGAKKMIQKQLRDLNLVPREDQFLAANYLANKVLASIGDLFAGAARIQKWFSAAAQLITKSSPEHRFRPGALPTKMTPVIWTTPIGLPVVQPYRKVKRKQVTTALQTIFLEDPNTPAAVDPPGQSSAFPPNFVHSLDATHMMLTAIECKKRNYTFASVHDSFWTHASDIDGMNEVLRKAFVDLHTAPILETLRSEMLQRYAGYRIPIVELSRGERQVLGLEKPKPRRKYVKKKNLAPASDNAITDELSEEHNDSAVPFSATKAIDGDLELDEEALARLRPQFKEVEPGSEQALTGTILLSDVLPLVPRRGDFDVREVEKSQYFFS